MRWSTVKGCICLLLGLLMLTGCVKKENPPNPAEKPMEKGIQDVSRYFPVESQLTWDYEGEGNEYAGFTRRVMHTQGNKAQVSEDNGGTVLGMVFEVTSSQVVKTYTKEEFYSDKNLLEEKPNLEEVILKAPLKVGATWKNERDQREVVSTSERVEVPGGTFHNVVKIKITSLEHPPEEGRQFEYYAENTGLILREFTVGEDKITSQLKSLKKTEARPQTQMDTLSIEGMQQEVVLHLVEGAPLPFYTYAPSDMMVERTASGEGEAFRFVANFAGKKRDDAYMSLFFYPQGTSVEEAVKFASGMILSNRWQKVGRYNNPDTEKSYPWSESEWQFMDKVNNQSYVGNIAVGKHGDRVFHIINHYPEDFAEGFVPRTGKILEKFTWTDTGEQLNKT